MSYSSPRLPKNPTDRQMRRAWGDVAWRCMNDGSWLPTYANGGSRVRVREQAPSTWIVLLDGTLCREHDGSALVWPDKFAAGFDALIMIKNHWHGPAYRFSPSPGWSQRQGFWMRPLRGAYLTARGHALRFDDTPVAVVREWQWPDEGAWGMFVGSTQRHVFQTLGMVMKFASADAARAAADDEVGRWQKSDEEEAVFYRERRRPGWWPPHD